jgi:hypothetical protein
MDSGTLVTIVLALTIPLGVFAVVWLVTRRVGAGAEGRADDLRAEVEKLGEEWVVPLRPGSYAGALHTYSGTRSNGVVGLTARRVLFQPIVGERLSFPLVRIRRVDSGHVLRGRASGGKRNLVLLLDDGNEIGFYVDEPQEFLDALTAHGVKRIGWDDDDPAPEEKAAPPE